MNKATLSFWSDAALDSLFLKLGVSPTSFALRGIDRIPPRIFPRLNGFHFSYDFEDSNIEAAVALIRSVEVELLIKSVISEFPGVSPELSVGFRSIATETILNLKASSIKYLSDMSLSIDIFFYE